MVYGLTHAASRVECIGLLILVEATHEELDHQVFMSFREPQTNIPEMYKNHIIRCTFINIHYVTVSVQIGIL